jgi:hypothetical protein
MPGLLVCEFDRSWSGVLGPCRSCGADMALRRPALAAGRVSIRRIPLALYKLGSQICSMSVSCVLPDGNQARRAVSSGPGSGEGRLYKCRERLPWLAAV